MTQNEKIALALNRVSHNDSFQSPMDRIVRITRGDSQVIHPGYAIQMLETRIKIQRYNLEQAEATLREIREDAVVEADEALARATGD